MRPHDIFARDGDDLHCEVPIRISQAALGDSVRVPTLGGEVELRIPVETQTGKVFRLRDKGVKSVRSSRNVLTSCSRWHRPRAFSSARKKS